MCHRASLGPLDYMADVGMQIFGAEGSRGKSFSGCRGANEYVQLSDPVWMKDVDTAKKIGMG